METTEPPTCLVHRKAGGSLVGARRPPLSADDPVASLPCVLCPHAPIGSTEPIALLIVAPLNPAEQRASEAGMVHAEMAYVVHQPCVDALNEAELAAVVDDLATVRTIVNLAGGPFTWTGDGPAEPDPAVPLVLPTTVEKTTQSPR